MTEEDRGARVDRERRLREAAVTAHTRRPPEPVDLDAEPEDKNEDAAADRIEQQALWVDLQVRQAMARGEFDNLPGAGKPLRGLDGTHDPDWWVKGLIERERITAALPPALALRNEDAELDAALDRETTEDGVRRTVADFNRRVVEARRQLLGGPPVVTPTRDVEQEVVAWRTRRAERRRVAREQRDHLSVPASAPGRPARRPRLRLFRSRRPRA
jgi:hypothetical protein